MKLKYYMRGVGVGMIFTAFIFMVVIIPNLELDAKQTASVVPRENASEKVTDILGLGTAEQEKAGEPEAEAVKSDEKVTVSGEINLIDKLEGAEKDNGSQKTEEVNENADTAGTAVMTDEGATVQEAASETKVQQENASAAENEAQQENAPVAETGALPENEQVQVINAVIKIGHGSTSEEVARNSEKAGLVSSWLEFNDYMISHGYADKLQSGDYQLNSAMSYDEMCKKFIHSN